jgi:hypothetical protein
MTLSESLAAILLLPLLLACLWRARLLALAILPPLLLALAQWLEVPGLESASHPSRWITSVACACFAGFAARGYVSRRELYRWQEWDIRRPHMVGKAILLNPRAVVASLLVLGSCAPDLLALHPFFWARFAEWPLVPIQIAVEVTIIAVLLAPERWVIKCFK